MRCAPPNKYKIHLFLYLSIMAVSLGAALILFVSVIRPIFIQRLQHYSEKSATEVVNNAIVTVFSENNAKYIDLVTLEKQSDGNVSALTTNTIKMNALRGEIAKALESELNHIDTEYLKIPLGNVLGNELFAGIGPDITVKIRPVAISKVDFVDNFEACGINQTRHTIYLSANVDISVITLSSKTSGDVSVKIPVAETIIVGTVPTYYGADSFLRTTLGE